MADVVLTGGDELDRRLRNLSSKLASKIASNAARKALRPILASAKRNAPKRTGRLRRSIKLGPLKRSRKQAGARVIIGTTDFADIGMTFYGAFQEFGWKTGKRGSENRRQIPGKHFLGRAVRERQQAALGIYKRELRKGIEAEATRG